MGWFPPPLWVWSGSACRGHRCILGLLLHPPVGAAPRSLLGTPYVRRGEILPTWLLSSPFWGHSLACSPASVAHFEVAPGGSRVCTSPLTPSLHYPVRVLLSISVSWWSPPPSWRAILMVFAEPWGLGQDAFPPLPTALQGTSCTSCDVMGKPSLSSPGGGPILSKPRAASASSRPHSDSPHGLLKPVSVSQTWSLPNRCI